MDSRKKKYDVDENVTEIVFIRAYIAALFGNEFFQ